MKSRCPQSWGRAHHPCELCVRASMLGCMHSMCAPWRTSACELVRAKVRPSAPNKNRWGKQSGVAP
eukprot:3109797-Alexandrium_andersonii.AAC.1